jgi:hypothetical protein
MNCYVCGHRKADNHLTGDGTCSTCYVRMRNWPLYCTCEAPVIGQWGACTTCERKPRALLRPL